MPHYASSGFWAAYGSLPQAIREMADRHYALLKANPQHPSLHFKRVGRFWSVRVGSGYRALGVDAPDGIVWIWIGAHAQYERRIRS